MTSIGKVHYGLYQIKARGQQTVSAFLVFGTTLSGNGALIVFALLIGLAVVANSLSVVILRRGML